MAKKLVTPPINISGSFVVNSPFKLTDSVVYKCYAIRTLKELISRNLDPFELYYKPAKVSESEYKKDLELGASIVSLISADNEYAYIPNTYIVSYPGMSGIPYSHKAILLDLGMVPDSIVLSVLLEDIKDLTTKSVGVEAKIREATIPYTGEITHEKHIDLERTRRLKIAKHKTKDEQLAEANATIAELRKAIDDIIKVTKK